jgi:hypothetical protein
MSEPKAMRDLILMGLRPTRSLRQGWWALPLRLIVGFGFMEHGYAKLARGPEVFAGRRRRLQGA